MSFFQGTILLSFTSCAPVLRSKKCPLMRFSEFWSSWQHPLKLSHSSNFVPGISQKHILWPWNMHTTLFRSNHAPVQPGQALFSLVHFQPNPDNGEVVFALLLESDNNNCQSFGLGKNILIPHGSKDTQLAEETKPLQYSNPTAQSAKDDTSPLAPFLQGHLFGVQSSNAMAIAYINLQGGTRKQTVFKETRQIFL